MRVLPLIVGLGISLACAPPPKGEDLLGVSLDGAIYDGGMIEPADSSAGTDVLDAFDSSASDAEFMDAESMSRPDTGALPDGGSTVSDAGNSTMSCMGAADGTIVSAGAFGTCGNFSSPCNESGTQTRMVEVCRAGVPETEIETQACTSQRIGCEDGILTRRVVGLPRIHDYSGAPEATVNAMIHHAINGLGLTIATAPEIRDRIFVGKWFMAWIDETGFYGKMNALWPLNGDSSNLEFTLVDNQRPVNVFVVGENGQGQWPAGYMGSEHIEYPNNTPEFDDDPSCANGLCAQYSLAEADPYTDLDIPTWSACNFGSPSFASQFVPIEITEQGNGIRLMYEGPLVKRGDFGGSTNGSNCHDDYLFSDNRRRRVYLRVGYVLGADVHFIDRLHQVRNPAGNPDFNGPESFIGGFVMTSWPNPHPLKQLHRYSKAGMQSQTVNWGGTNVSINNGSWTRLPNTVPTQDIVLGWSGQPMSLSPYPANVNGRAYTLSNEGPRDNRDTGFCLCYVHGGIEMGGGLLHGTRHGDGMAIVGGTTSYVAVRRLQIRHEDPVPQPFHRIYEAETDLSHTVGQSDTDGWIAQTVPDQPGYMAFGPYAMDWPEDTLTVTFRMMVDVADNRSETVVTVDLFDATAGQIVSIRPISRNEFSQNFQYQDFTVSIDMIGRLGHSMETRVFWHDISYVKLDRVTVDQ